MRLACAEKKRRSPDRDVWGSYHIPMNRDNNLERPVPGRSGQIGFGAELPLTSRLCDNRLVRRTGGPVGLVAFVRAGERARWPRLSRARCVVSRTRGGRPAASLAAP